MLVALKNKIPQEMGWYVVIQAQRQFEFHPGMNMFFFRAHGVGFWRCNVMFMCLANHIPPKSLETIARQGGVTLSSAHWAMRVVKVLCMILVHWLDANLWFYDGYLKIFLKPTLSAFLRDRLYLRKLGSVPQAGWVSLWALRIEPWGW